MGGFCPILENCLRVLPQQRRAASRTEWLAVHDERLTQREVVLACTLHWLKQVSRRDLGVGRQFVERARDAERYVGRAEP
jgi:hypothetical protein